MKRRIDVLDHGYVELIDHMGGDISIVRNARQSYNADWRAGEDMRSDNKLIKFLLRENHTGPFEHATINIGVKPPIFVARQWHRHRTQSYSEVSARYTELPEEFYIPTISCIGKQSKNNKQVRDLEEKAGVSKADSLFIHNLQIHSVQGFRYYQESLANGIPRELARLFLGLNTYTRFSTTANLHNWFHFLRLRLHPHAQYEIRVYANAILEMIEPLYPVAVEAFISTLVKE